MLKKSLRSHIFLLLALSNLVFSCVTKPTNQPTEIRIVDLNGKAKPIKRMMPEGNAQMLAMQNENAPSNNFTQDNNTEISNNTTTENALSLNNQDSIQNTEQPLAPIEQNQITDNKPIEAVISYDMSENSNKTNQDETKVETNKTKASELENNNINNLEPNLTTTKNLQQNKKFKFVSIKTKLIENDSNIKSDGGEILIQIGFFASSSNAENLLAQSKKVSKGLIKEVNVNGQSGYKVFLGPTSNHQSAIKILTKAKKFGYKDAFIVK